MSEPEPIWTQLPQGAACVYALTDPGSGDVRYVGWTTQPGRRFVAHKQGRGKNHRAAWIRKLKRAGQLPKMVLLCVFNSQEEAKRVEVELIARLSKTGLRLTNKTAGGDGVLGMRHTMEARRVMSQKKKSLHREKPELLDALRGLRRGVKNSALSNAKRSATLTGRSLSAEHRANLSKSRLGMKFTEEHRENLSKAHRGRRRSPRKSKDETVF